MSNINTYLSSIHVDAILENLESLPYDCKGSQYVDKDHKDIITGGVIMKTMQVNVILCFCKIWELSVIRETLGSLVFYYFNVYIYIYIYIYNLYWSGVEDHSNQTDWQQNFRIEKKNPN